VDTTRSLFNAYQFMGINETDTIDQIRRQYKDLIILWHPDKHYNNSEDYAKYEKLTKQLNSSYNEVVDYINANGQPTFNITSNKFEFIKIYEIPKSDYGCWPKADYDIDMGIGYNIEAMTCNAITSALNALNPIFEGIGKRSEKRKLERINAFVNEMKNTAINKNTIRFGSTSYLKKANIVTTEYRDESLICKIFSNKSFYSNVNRYIDYLNSNTFCGIAHWRVMSANDLCKLLCFARAQGYDIGGDKLYVGFYDNDHKYLTDCDINNGYVYISDFKHVPLNGHKFREFMITIGFYGIENDFVYYKHNNNILKFDVNSCTGSSYCNNEKVPSLWPVSNEVEGAANVYIAHNSNATVNDIALSYTQDKAKGKLIELLTTVAAIILGPILGLAAILLAIVLFSKLWELI